MSTKRFVQLLLIVIGIFAFQCLEAATPPSPPPPAAPQPGPTPRPPAPDPPAADFTLSPTSPFANELVWFRDQSDEKPTSWSWSFGDGATSTLQNPSHAYSAGGTYTVTLRASNAGGTSIARKSLTVKLAPPVAGFSFSPTAPTAAQTVSFTDTSTGNPTSWSWSFGDGATSTLQNPSHAYSTVGAFTVTLTATNAGGSGTSSKNLTVAAGGPVGPASCTVSADCAAAGACPKDAAKGCTCSSMSQGKMCVPQCTTAADCPKPQDKTLICSSQGLCVPDGGGNGGGGGNTDGGAVMNTENTISDQAQSATIAFDGLAFVTGSFCAQTFYPPGKVADFFGFQYLRDNDPSNLGHNTEFTTLSADPILAILTDAQVNTFITLADKEKVLSDEYGYARFPLAKAFRRLMDGDVSAGHEALSRDAVKAYSGYLYSIDGEMSYLRAQAYASVLRSMDASQKAVLDAMKGKGSAEWNQPATEPAALKKYGTYGVQLRTYAGEMFAWYAGNIDADVYFCPEREGTYFGSFFMKDIKAMHNPNYTIDSNMTADMGNTFLQTLDATQKAKVTGLVTEQKEDLLEIVAKREQISTLLRNFLKGGTVDEATVVGLAEQYGELDGEISYYYTTRFSEVGKTLNATQKSTLMALRKKATAEDNGSADYDTMCGNGYLYSAPLSAPPTVMNTDFMFGVCSAASSACSTDWTCCSFSCVNNICAVPFTFTSSAFQDGGTLPATFTCDGAGGGHSPPLAWAGAPEGTVEFAITMTTVALDGVKYNWVLYHIPANVTSLSENVAGIGAAGVSTDGPELRYYPSCSTGPGAKTYTFTIHALSGVPTFSVPANQVTGDILMSAISPLIIGTRQMSVTYTRSGL
jgi:PKD repeat protein/phosphatidylethanolamine-binding protein (PEBP) family uncharacterized protein